jgi:hypothetical protein
VRALKQAIRECPLRFVLDPMRFCNRLGPVLLAFGTEPGELY